MLNLVLLGFGFFVAIAIALLCVSRYGFEEREFDDVVAQQAQVLLATSGSGGKGDRSRKKLRKPKKKGSENGSVNGSSEVAPTSVVVPTPVTSTSVASGWGSATTGATAAVSSAAAAGAPAPSQQPPASSPAPAAADAATTSVTSKDSSQRRKAVKTRAASDIASPTSAGTPLVSSSEQSTGQNNGQNTNKKPEEPSHPSSGISGLTPKVPAPALPADLPVLATTSPKTNSVLAPSDDKRSVVVETAIVPSKATTLEAASADKAADSEKGVMEVQRGEATGAAAAPGPRTAAAGSLRSKAKKPANDIASLLAAFDEAVLSKAEIQLLADALLTRQDASAWTTKQQKVDPLTMLKKQLEERELQLADEKQVSANATSRMNQARQELQDERSQFVQRDRKAQESIAMLQKDVAALTARMTESHEQHALELAAMNDQLKAGAALKQEIERLEQALKEAQAAMTALKVESAEQVCSEVKSPGAAVIERQQASEPPANHHASEQKRCATEVPADISTTAEESVADMVQRMKDAHEKLAAADEKIESLSAELAEANEVAKRRENDLQQAEETISRLHRALAQAEEASKERDAELQSLQHRANLLDNELKAHEQQAHQQPVTTSSQTVDEAAAVAAARADADEQRALLAQQIKATESLQMQLDKLSADLQQEWEQRDAQAAALAAAGEKLHGAEQLLGEARAREASLAAELGSARTKISELQHKMWSVAEAVESTDRLAAEVPELRAQLESRTAALSLLRASVKRLEKQNAELEEEHHRLQQSESERYRSELLAIEKQKQADIEHLQNELKLAVAEATRLRDELDRVLRASEESQEVLNAKVKAAREECYAGAAAQAVENTAALEAQLSEAQAELADSRALIKELEGEQHLAAQQQIKNMEQLQNELLAATAEAARLRDDLDQLRQASEESQKEAEATVKAAREEVAGTVAALEKAAGALKGELDEVHQELAASRASVKVALEDKEQQAAVVAQAIERELQLRQRAEEAECQAEEAERRWAGAKAVAERMCAALPVSLDDGSGDESSQEAHEHGWLLVLERKLAALKQASERTACEASASADKYKDLLKETESQLQELQGAVDAAERGWKRTLDSSSEELAAVRAELQKVITERRAAVPVPAVQDTAPKVQENGHASHEEREHGEAQDQLHARLVSDLRVELKLLNQKNAELGEANSQLTRAASEASERASAAAALKLEAARTAVVQLFPDLAGALDGQENDLWLSQLVEYVKKSAGAPSDTPSSDASSLSQQEMAAPEEHRELMDQAAFRPANDAERGGETMV